MSEWCACRTRNPVACVASVSRAKNARNIFAFAPFFARAKRRKSRFFALCSTETLATQATRLLASFVDSTDLAAVAV